MDGLTIRTAWSSDIDALRDVRARASMSNEGDRENLLAHPELLDFEGEGIADGRTRAAVVDDRVIGFSTVVVTGDVDDLDDLFVDPDWMRHGVGLALMSDVVERARSRGARYLEVTANPHALEFYAAAGFHPHGAADTLFGPAARLQIVL
jgi:GNAT superfamily N-acetyltransferase